MARNRGLVIDRICSGEFCLRNDSPAPNLYVGKSEKSDFTKYIFVEIYTQPKFVAVHTEVELWWPALLFMLILAVSPGFPRSALTRVADILAHHCLNRLKSAGGPSRLAGVHAWRQRFHLRADPVRSDRGDALVLFHGRGARRGLDSARLVAPSLLTCRSPRDAAQERNLAARSS